MSESEERDFFHGEQRFCIAGLAGPLEVATIAPVQAVSEYVAVICHPDPCHGGTMDNKVVTTVARAFKEMGISSVRFNYRGVGQSAGQHAAGLGETADCLHLLHWLWEQKPRAQVILAGFSFGAYVALRAAPQVARLALLLSIAPAVGLRAFETLIAPDCPWLIIQGEEDEIVDAQAVYAWAAQLPVQARLLRMPGAGHFFHGQLIALRECIVEQVALLLPG